METYQVNKIYTDDFGRVNGVFAYNKPAGVSSHDIVYKFRRHFKTKKVGHAGTLDPFADGILIVLVGKATKLSDSFLAKDKEYKARILLGVETNSGDPEGDIVASASENIKIDEVKIKEVLKSFTPEYLQSVPLFSSVKIGGKKLRELARSYSSFEIKMEDSKTIVNFLDNNKEVKKTIELPSKVVQIYNIELLGSGYTSKKDLVDIFNNAFLRKENIDPKILNLDTYQYIDILVSVSKGTYVRQLAIDIGKKLDVPAMLIALTRTKVGETSIDNTYSIESEK